MSGLQPDGLGENKTFGSLKADETNNTVTVRAEDGETAISDAVTRISDGERRALSFEAGETFPITSDVSIPLNKVSNVLGNGAFLEFQGDHTVWIEGSETVGTAAPGGTNDDLAETEMGPLVTGLRAYSTTEPYTGQIGLMDTFGVTITGCNIAKLKDGLLFDDGNRNPKILGNSIWDCRETCIHFLGGNIHQILIGLNQLSYANRIVHIEPGNHADYHFVGNDMETGNEPPNPTAVVDLETSRTIPYLGFSNCAFQAHNEDVVLLRVSSGEGDSNDSHEGLRVTGCNFEAATTGIYLENVDGGAITGNTFRNLSDIAVEGAGILEGVGVNANSFFSRASSDAGAGVRIESDKRIRSLSVSGNEFVDWLGQPIQITDSGSSPTDKAAVRVCANNIDIDSDASFSGEYLIDLNTQSAVRGLQMAENQVIAADIGENGYRVTTGSIDKAILKNNITEGMSNGTAFNFPSEAADSIIVSDNI